MESWEMERFIMTIGPWRGDEHLSISVVLDPESQKNKKFLLLFLIFILRCRLLPVNLVGKHFRVKTLGPRMSESGHVLNETSRSPDATYPRHAPPASVLR